MIDLQAYMTRRPLSNYVPMMGSAGLAAPKWPACNRSALVRISGEGCYVLIYGRLIGRPARGWLNSNVQGFRKDKLIIVLSNGVSG